MVLAIDIGGTNFSLALATARGKLSRVVTRSTDRSGGVAWMVESLVSEGRKRRRTKRRVDRCGISFGGPVDFEDQRIVNSTQVAGWDDFPLSKVIQAEFGLPAIVDNDANVGALGELAFGAGRGVRNLVFYNIGTGIGAGIIIQREIFRGSNGNAGELGHVPILPDGPRCDCGNRGCLEALCSGSAIGRRAEEAIEKRPRLGKAILRVGDGRATAKAVFDAARADDRLALNVTETAT